MRELILLWTLSTQRATPLISPLLKGRQAIPTTIRRRCRYNDDTFDFLVHGSERDPVGHVSAGRPNSAPGSRLQGGEAHINVRIAEATLDGISVGEYEANSSGAKAYQALAQEVIRRGA
ncbi:MAG: hypothetical protein KA314_29190 [Chloroflexi bacterium]|nr:hypothetical protein [Chloroflexota bacterium]MBP8059934.1 hypothetical protein [Chloroflexota bacterium]